jgi:uncharacterized protein (TIGR02147 family)
MQHEPSHFISVIQRSIEEKCKKNPKYSLRAHARVLGVSPASLSGVITGKRKLTLPMIEKIGLRMGLDQEQVWEYQRQLIGSKIENSNQDKFSRIAQDEFSIITDWYNLAILEVMKLKGFKGEILWVSKKLGINQNQVQSAISRLKRLGIIEIKEGQWIDRTKGFTTHLEKGKTSEARRLYQQQLLEKSTEALVQDDVSLRDHTSMTMAIDSRDLQLAKEEIAKFRRRLSRLLEKRNSADQVYQLQISFFGLTK